MSTSQDLHRLSAIEAQRHILDGSINVEQYVTALLSYTESRKPVNKAWVYLDSTLVLEQARRLDQLPPSARGPLHGIPIGVKDTILTRDMPTQYNSPIFPGTVGSGVDAACIRVLRAAGAIIFGKTTTTEFAATSEGGIHQNHTVNVHDPSRTPGGSSSGSAVAVADFQVPLALGTQTGGSVVRPASYNGIFGLKYTWGAVSTEGVSQYSVTCDTLGAFARTVDDLKLISGVLRVIDVSPESRLSTRTNLDGAKIGFCRTHVWKEAENDLKQVWEVAKRSLSSMGAVVEEFELPADFANVSRWHADVSSGEGRASFLGQYLMEKGQLASFLCGLVENNKNISRAAMLEAYDGCGRLRPVWDKIAAGYDAVVTPSVPGQAPMGLGSTGSAVS